MFELWEVEMIFGGGVKMAELEKVSEENQNVEKLRNKIISYKFLYSMLQTASDCPARFKGTERTPQPYSIYSTLDA